MSIKRMVNKSLDHRISNAGPLITDFQSADDIVVKAEEEESIDVLEDRLDTTNTMYKMENGFDK